MPVYEAPSGDIGEGGVSSPESFPSLHKTTSEAGAWITRDNYHWGSTLGEAPDPISFGFRISAPSYSDPYRDTQSTFTPMTAEEQAAVRLALNLWSSVANVTF